MDTSLERIREKISDLEEKIASLRIAERELQALDGRTTRKPRAKSAKAIEIEEEESEPVATKASGGRQTIGAAIIEILGEHGALPVGGIAEQIQASGRDITNRAISFTLQALKKRSLVKSVDGEWTLPKPRGRRPK
jgi:hypothetical protein